MTAGATVCTFWSSFRLVLVPERKRHAVQRIPRAPAERRLCLLGGAASTSELSSRNGTSPRSCASPYHPTRLLHGKFAPAPPRRLLEAGAERRQLILRDP